MSTLVATPATAPVAEAGLTWIESNGDVHLPEVALRPLRLAQSEAFLAIASGRQAVHLLRASLAPAPGAGERLALFGSIERFGVADLFSLLNMSRGSGLLVLSSSGVLKGVHFRRGEIVFATTNQPEERLGRMLFRIGKLSAESLQAAEARSASATGPGRRFGALLLEQGAIDAATLWWGVRHQMEEIVYSIFRLDQGTFHFFEGDYLDPDLAHFAIDTNHVLMEGYRRVDEWVRIEKRLGQRGILRPTGRKPKERQSEANETLLALVDGRRSLEEIVRAAGLGEFATYRELFRLLQGGLIEAIESTENLVDSGTFRLAEDPERASLLALIERSNRACMLVRDVLRAKSVEVDLGRLFAGFLRAGSDAVRTLLQGLVPNAQGRLNPELLIENLGHLQTAPAVETSVGAGSWSGVADDPAARRLRLDRALAEWRDFQILAAVNLLPTPEVAELVTYVRAIERSGE